MEKAGVKREEDTDETEDDKGGVSNQIGADEATVRGYGRWIRQKRFLVVHCHDSRQQNRFNVEEGPYPY